jgi:tetratricopeptide (TPR) repeat protein
MLRAVQFFRLTSSAAVALLVCGIALAQEAATTEEPAEQPAATPEAPAQNPLIEKGYAALKAGDFNAAMAAFEQAAQEGQQAQDGTLGLAAILGRVKVLVAMGELEEAKEGLNNILSGQDIPDAYIARGEVNLEMNLPDEALTDFEQAVKLQRGNMAAQFGLGKALVMLGQYDKAIKPLSRVLAADPQNAEVLRLRGTSLGGMYKNKEAIADLEQSLQLNPDDYETYFNLGIVYLREENYQGAADQFAKGVERYKPKPGQEDQPYLQGYLTWATALIELGKNTKDDAALKAAYQQSIEVTNRLLDQLGENNPYAATARAAALHGRGVAERMLGDYGTAIRTFTQAIELNPDLADAYFRRGICFHLIGEDKMAISDFSESAHIDLSDPRAALWEGFTYAKMGEYHEALRAYGNAIAASDRYTPAYVNRGLAYMALGDFEKAVADFNDAIRLAPTTADYYFKRGVAYEKLGDNQKASESFASAIEFDDKHAEAYRHMADVMQALGRTELSNEYRQKATELAPKDKK